jgi:hypothetical protein
MNFLESENEKSSHKKVISDQNKIKIVKKYLDELRKDVGLFVSINLSAKKESKQKI